MMDALRALVLSDTQLRELLRDAAREGATLAVDQLRGELHQSQKIRP